MNFEAEFVNNLPPNVLYGRTPQHRSRHAIHADLSDPEAYRMAMGTVHETCAQMQPAAGDDSVYVTLDVEQPSANLWTVSMHVWQK